jgi:uncharacterized membrane protein
MSDGENSAAPAPLPAPDMLKTETLAEVIREKAPEVLDSIPPEKRAALARVTIEKHEFSMRASPLPDPAELAAYNQIIPNGADRILAMAENQSSHRIKIETIAISSQQRQGFFGQICALIIALSGLGLATYAAVNGQPEFGSIIGGSTLVSIVSAFLYSKHVQKKDLNEKKSQVQQVGPPHMLSGKQKKKNRHK